MLRCVALLTWGASFASANGMHRIACGRNGRCDRKNEYAKCEASAEKHEVRCCADKQPRNGRRNNRNFRKKRNCKVWGASKVNRCVHAATYEKAAETCKKIGARLCTEKELNDDCTRGTGCGHDADLVWTKDTCASVATPAPVAQTSSGQGMHRIACGRNGRCDRKNEYAKCEASTGKHEVRCCADKQPKNGRRNNRNFRKKRNCKVWGASKVNRCVHAATYEKAAETCKKIGARLCTEKELNDDCTRGTGCGHDADLVWTKDTCGSPASATATTAATAPVAQTSSGQGVCDERLHGRKDKDYRGCQTITRSGKLCQRWDSQEPHSHSRTPKKYRNSGLVENYCRNPDGENTIWCYTTDAKVRWEYCDPVPRVAPVAHTAPTSAPVAAQTPVAQTAAVQDKWEKGFCTINGRDQNSGVVKVNKENGNSAKAQATCLEACRNRKGATGCEVIWDQGNRGCYVHTKPVTEANGTNRHLCVIFAPAAQTAPVANTAPVAAPAPVAQTSSVQGPAGSAGKQGERGLRGEKGPVGAQGPSGRQGERGEQGPAGAPGKDGSDGEMGPMGRQGTPGQNGRDGKTGSEGKPGSDGVDGKPGPVGLEGRPGPMGAEGRPGEDGLKGQDGQDGLSGKPGSDGHDGKPGSQGPAGKPGHDGQTGPIGKQGPAGTPGQAGQQGQTGPAGIQGPKGETGPRGERGERGEHGAMGEAGLEGPVGPAGHTGETGPSGPKGDQGERGERGQEGERGQTGAPGHDGHEGSTGPAGQNGMQGMRGEKGERGEQGPTGPEGPSNAPELESQIEENKRQIDESERNFSESQKQMETSFEPLHNGIAENKNRIEKTDHELSETGREISDLQVALEEKDRDFEARDNEIKVNNQRIEEVQSQVEEGQRQADENHKLSEELNHHVETSKRQMNSNNERIEENQRQIEESDNVVNHLRDENERQLNESRDESERKLRENREENDRKLDDVRSESERSLNEMRDQMRKENEQKMNEMRMENERQLHEMRNQLNELQSRESPEDHHDSRDDSSEDECPMENIETDRCDFDLSIEHEGLSHSDDEGRFNFVNADLLIEGLQGTQSFIAMEGLSMYHGSIKLAKSFLENSALDLERIDGENLTLDIKPLELREESRLILDGIHGSSSQLDIDGLNMRRSRVELGKISLVKSTFELEPVWLEDGSIKVDSITLACSTLDVASINVAKGHASFGHINVVDSTVTIMSFDVKEYNLNVDSITAYAATVYIEDKDHMLSAGEHAQVDHIEVYGAKLTGWFTPTGFTASCELQVDDGFCRVGENILAGTHMPDYQTDCKRDPRPPTPRECNGEDKMTFLHELENHEELKTICAPLIADHFQNFDPSTPETCNCLLGIFEDDMFLDNVPECVIEGSTTIYSFLNKIEEECMERYHQ